MNHKLAFVRAVSLTALAVGLSNVAAQAQGIASGDLLVFQVGANGSTTTLGSSGTADFLNEYTVSGSQIQQIAIPTTNSGTNLSSVSSGSATSEGGLTLSMNGQYASFVGYNAAVGTANVATTTTNPPARVIGNINLATGAIDTSTGLTDAYTGNNIRDAVSTNGTAFYTAGTAATGQTNSGVHYATDGATTSAQLTSSTTLGNVRRVSIYNGQLYASSGSGSFVGVSTVGNGLPTSGTQTATLITSGTGQGTSPYDFFFTNPNTLYVADTGTGLEKFSSADGVNFTFSYATALSGVTGFVGSSVANVFYAVTPGALYSVTDTQNATTKFTTTSIATASANTAFRDLIFNGVVANNGVMPEPGVLPLAAEAGALVLGFGVVRRRRKA